MKRLKIILLFICTVNLLVAQTGIGTTTPDASAKLDVSSTNKGFLPPRVTLTSETDNTTIPSPATGLLVYNTGNNSGLVAGYYYWNGTSWATIATASGYSVGSSYMRGSRSAAQTTNLTTTSRVAFTQVDNTSGQEISLNTGTGQITLAAGRTYRLMAQVPNMSGGTRPAFAWYNETTSSWIGSQSSVYSTSDPASYIAFGSVSDAIITANSTTVVSYRIYSGSSLGSLGGNADFNLLGSYPWFDIQVISGNSVVNGQTVDYVMASLSANQSISAVGNVQFNSIQGAGITLNNGGFNLSANKNYWEHIFWMPGVPVPMKFFMMPIELIGVLTKPFALMIRLFANITAGHIIVLALISIIFINKNVAWGGLSVPMALFISILELLVAFLQAFLFSMLSALFIGAAVEEAHH